MILNATVLYDAKIENSNSYWIVNPTSCSLFLLIHLEVLTKEMGENERDDYHPEQNYYPEDYLVLILMNNNKDSKDN